MNKIFRTSQKLQLRNYYPSNRKPIRSYLNKTELPKKFAPIDFLDLGYDCAHPFRRTIDDLDNKINVGIISNGISEDEIAVLEEGARRNNANFILIYDPSTLRYSPFINAVTISSGLMFIDNKLSDITFNNPQFMHSILNHIEELDIVLDAIYLKGLVESITDFELNSKFAGYIRMEDFSVSIPKFLYFMPVSNKENTEETALQISKIINAEIKKIVNSNVIRNLQQEDDLIKQILIKFLELSVSSEGVLKPNNDCGGNNIFFFNKDNLNNIIKTFKKLLFNNKAIIIQERIIPPQLKINDETFDFNFRIFISLDENCNPVISDILVRYGNFGQAINICKGAKVMDYEELIEKLNLIEQEKDQLKNNILNISIETFKALEKHTKTLWGLSPSFLGLDVMIDKDLTPYVTEVNGKQSGGMYDMDRYLRFLISQGKQIDINRIGKSSRDLVSLLIKNGMEHKIQVTK